MYNYYSANNVVFVIINLPNKRKSYSAFLLLPLPIAISFIEEKTSNIIFWLLFFIMNILHDFYLLQSQYNTNKIIIINQTLN